MATLSHPSFVRPAVRRPPRAPREAEVRTRIIHVEELKAPRADHTWLYFGIGLAAIALWLGGAFVLTRPPEAPSSPLKPLPGYYPERRAPQPVVTPSAEANAEPLPVEALVALPPPPEPPPAPVVAQQPAKPVVANQPAKPVVVVGKHKSAKAGPKFIRVGSGSR